MSRVKVYVTPKKGVLDPQGKTVEAALHSMGYKNVNNLKIGKYIEMEVTGPAGKIKDQVEEMCKKLLSNPVIEDFNFEISQ